MKITNEIIDKINLLYLKIGTYSGVAKEIGCAPSTVKKYIKKDYQIPNNIPIKKFNSIITPVQREKFLGSNNWGEFCILSNEEREEMKELWEEMVI